MSLQVRYLLTTTPYLPRTSKYISPAPPSTWPLSNAYIGCDEGRARARSLTPRSGSKPQRRAFQVIIRKADFQEKARALPEFLQRRRVTRRGGASELFFSTSCGCRAQKLRRHPSLAPGSFSKQALQQTGCRRPSTRTTISAEGLPSPFCFNLSPICYPASFLLRLGIARSGTR